MGDVRGGGDCPLRHAVSTVVEQMMNARDTEKHGLRTAHNRVSGTGDKVLLKTNTFAGKSVVDQVRPGQGLPTGNCTLGEGHSRLWVALCRACIVNSTGCS